MSFMFTRGWGCFLRMNNFNQNDTIFFYVCDNGDHSVYYMIDAQRKKVEKSDDDLRGKFDNVTEVDGVREDTNKVVKLFGVLIG